LEVALFNQRNKILLLTVAFVAISGSNISPLGTLHAAETVACFDGIAKFCGGAARFCGGFASFLRGHRTPPARDVRTVPETGISLIQSPDSTGLLPQSSAAAPVGARRSTTPPASVEAGITDYRSYLNIEISPQGEVRSPNAEKRKASDNNRKRKGVYEQGLDILKRGGYWTVVNGELIPVKVNTKMNYQAFKDYKDALKSYERNKAEESKFETKVEVKNMDTAEAALKLQEEEFNVALLVNGNERLPGGGVRDGDSPQEEEMARKFPMLSKNLEKAYVEIMNKTGINPELSISDMDSTYKTSKEKHGKERYINESGAIYCEAEAIWQSTINGKGNYVYSLRETPQKLGLITVAADHFYKDDNIIRRHLDCLETTKNRINTILQVALNNGHDTLVLGALGCGIYQNDPKVISHLFNEALESNIFKGRFKKIVFAIKANNPNDSNLMAFRDEFSGNGTGKQLLEDEAEKAASSAAAAAAEAPITEPLLEVSVQYPEKNFNVHHKSSDYKLDFKGDVDKQLKDLYNRQNGAKRHKLSMGNLESLSVRIPHILNKKEVNTMNGGNISIFMIVLSAIENDEPGALSKDPDERGRFEVMESRGSVFYNKQTKEFSNKEGGQVIKADDIKNIFNAMIKYARTQSGMATR